MNTSTLFVPIDLEAMVVNDQARKAESYQRWQMDYQNLNAYASPMPPAFSGNTAANWNNDPSANGVYLHWSLPQALRRGRQDSVSGKTDYPLVPNRWLVVRYSGPLTARTAAAWVVESDFLDPDTGTSPYIDPRATTQLAVTLIGRKVDIAGWKETGTDALFLTAVGTGDITFAAYQPYNENVFSIHDPLTGVNDQDVLSYMVAGWYSDTARDVLAGVTDEASFISLLASLDWEVTNTTAPPCNQSVYQGLCYSITWDKAGPVPASDKPAGATLAAGNTSIDALTALIATQAQGDASVDANLLEAFQYNLLPLLDQPNGQDLLDQAIHKAWFGSTHGGYEWVIVKAPSEQQGNPDSPVDWNDANLTPAWLYQLNQDQAAYDDAMLLLQHLQWKVYRMWWTKGAFDNIGAASQQYLDFTDAEFEQQLDPTQQGTVAWQAVQQGQVVSSALSKIPHGATQGELQASINAYETLHFLPEGYQLKCYTTGSFYKANDPVVLIAGSKASAPLTDADSLPCRYDSQLITGLTFETKPVDAASMNGKIPAVGLGNLPIDATALLNEFFFLDPGNAPMIAAIALNDPGSEPALASQMTAHTGYTGTLPDQPLVAWQQPWSPMFLLWTVLYYPIAHDEQGALNWQFDGADYVLSNQHMPEVNPTNIVLSGTTLLTPQSSFIFKKRLDEFRTNHPDLDEAELNALEDFITSTDDWDFLSQSLDGFMRQLTCIDNSSNVIPATSTAIGQIIGARNSNVPILGGVPQPFQGWPPSNFQPFRSGQFCFEKMALADRFGQSLQLVSSQDYLQLKPVISPDMTPEYTVLPEEPYRFIQLSPRLLQPARLDFDFVSALDDSKVINLHGDVNPVCAWILPNHLDRSLACYDPTGSYLGELRLITNDQAVIVVYWDNAPLSPYDSLDQVATAFPHLGEMLRALIAEGPGAFGNFYQVIDETLWVVDPLGARDDQNLSVLVGRPLALTRCRLQYELDGPAVTDPSWQFTFQDDAPEFMDYVFPVKLGELQLRNDGLIGYFTGADYSQFNASYVPDSVPATLYIQPIAVGNFIDLTFSTGSEAYLTMLLDPRAVVHATTSILPVLTLELPARFVAPALANMEVTFKVGPLLSGSTTAGTTVSVLMPRPSETNGVWTWMEQDAAGGVAPWNSYPIMPTDEDADLSNVPPVLRTGLLKLSSAMKDGQSLSHGPEDEALPAGLAIGQRHPGKDATALDEGPAY